MDKNKPYINKVGIVTGASSGIGYQICLDLSKKGMTIAAFARREEKLEDLAGLIKSHGGQFYYEAFNIKEEKKLIGFFNRVKNKFGRLDLLVNNAGLGHKSPLLDGETQLWRDMLEINVIALSVCSREAVKHMGENSGQIIHNSSMSGHRVPGGSGMYSATKFAVRSLTEGLRKELREINSPIRIHCLSPGFVETEFAEKYHQDRAIAQDLYSSLKVLEAKDISKTIEFLLQCPKHMEIHDILMRPTQQSS